MKGCVRYRIPDIMEAKDKYYYIPTENARPHEPWTTTQLPIEMEVNKPVTAKFTSQ